MKIKIKAYQAIENRNLCDEYSEGHVQILRDFGITNVTTNNEEWKTDSNVFFLLCYDMADNQPVGGVRIQKFDGLNYPPVCHAVGHIDKEIYQELNASFISGAAEICGLWAHKRVLGRGLGTILTRAGVSFSTQIAIKTMYCITAQFNIDMVEAIGFRRIVTMGTNGIFAYPNELYQASVMKIEDITQMSDSALDVRLRMLSLRQNPSQYYTEIVNKKEIEIFYNLSL